MTTESLTKSESLYRGLFDYMTSGSAIYEVMNDGSKGSDYIVKNFNRKSLEIEGKTLEEVLGKSLSDLRPNIDEYGLIPVMRKVWKTGEPACFPVKMYQDDQFSAYYENFIFRIPTGEVVTIYDDVTDQKNTEQRLAESRSQIKVLIDTIPDLIWLKDPDGVYLGCNPTFERFFGAKEKTIAGKTDYDFVDRDLADFFRAHDRKAMEADGPSINEEWLTFAEDGYHGLFETIKTPMKTPDGRLVGVLGIARDITERKKSEEVLRENERRYKSAQRIGKVGNWEYDLDTGKFWGSSEAKRIYGFDPEVDRFTTDDVENCIPDRERVHQALLDLIEQGTPYDIEFEIRPVSGPEKRMIRSIAEVIRDEDGNPEKVAGVIQDITQNKLAEQQLRHSEEKFRLLFESAKEAFYFSSVQGKFIEANQSFFKLFGMEKEDLNKLWAKDIYLNPDDRSKFIDIIEKHGFVKDFEVKLMDRTGNVMDCQISATVRRSMDGSIEGYQGIIRDTTEMKQKDLEKERLIADLQKALAEVKKLSGLLPICMHCKKIRDDQGYWKQMEEYLAKHSEAQFSHSICRECAEKYYPDMDVYDK